MFDLLLDRLRLRGAVTRLLQLSRQIGKGADQLGHKLIQGQTQCLFLAQRLFIGPRLTAEIMLIIELRLGRFHWLTQGADGFQSVIQILFGLGQSILEQPGHILLVITREGLGRIVVDRLLQRLEQVFVIDDVAVLLVVTIEPIHPADGLEQVVISHLLVDIEVGG